MGANERSVFFRRLEEFQDERGEDSGPPLFAKKAVDTWKLWNAVQESGGFYEVTNCKGWARIGRLFDPPRTMTDLSFRIKKIYEVHLLPFEKAIDEGRFPDVYVPPRAAPAQQQSVSRAGRTSVKRQSNSRATPTPSTRPKRARKEAGHSGLDENLVGKVIKVYKPEEGKYSRGTVESFEKDVGLHKIKFDEGGLDYLDLNIQEWSFDGPDNGLDIERLNELRNQAYALDDEEAFGNESDCEDLAPPKPRDSLPKDCVEDRIHDDRGYKVYFTSDGRGYEIFCLVPALQLDSVRVKAWETGKILVRHVGQSKGSDLTQLTYRIRLPSGIVATETQAIITLHQQLYVRVPMFIAQDAKVPKSTAIPQGESAVQAVTSETLEQEVKGSPGDENAISPDRSNAISPEKLVSTHTQNNDPGLQNDNGVSSVQPFSGQAVNGQQTMLGLPGVADNGRQAIPVQGMAPAFIPGAVPVPMEVYRATPLNSGGQVLGAQMLGPQINGHNFMGSQLNQNASTAPRQAANPNQQQQYMHFTHT